MISTKRMSGPNYESKYLRCQHRKAMRHLGLVRYVPDEEAPGDEILLVRQTQPGYVPLKAWLASSGGKIAAQARRWRERKRFGRRGNLEQMRAS